MRELTPETSLGFSVVTFAEEVLGLTLYPWQRWLLIHALELLEDGSLRFRTVLVLVARQNGKSTVGKVLALWWLYVCGAELVLGTAQDLDTAEETWAAAVDLAEESEALAGGIKKVHQRNGHKALELWSGEKYRVKAASRSAARGLTGHKILLDELREHKNWDAWGAITKTTMAIEDAQIWCLSNAGDIASVVLKYLRLKAHELLGDPDGIVARSKIMDPTIDDLSEELLDLLDDEPGEALSDEDLEVASADIFLAEWSTAPGRKVDDRDGWAESNPSMGWSPPNEKAIASACHTDVEWVFRTEVLCQWPEGGMEGPFPPGTWDQSLNPTVETPTGPVLAMEDWIVGSVVACVAVSADRSRSHIAIAGRRLDGTPQVEIHASRIGTGWVRPWLVERRGLITAVTGQTNGANVSPLMAELKGDRKFRIPVVDWAGANLAAAHGQAHDAVRDGTVRHNPQMALDLAAASAVKKQMDGGGWVLNLLASPTDAATLQAWIGAYWLLQQPPPQSPPPPPPTAVKKSSTTDPAPPAIASQGVNLATVSF